MSGRGSRQAGWGTQRAIVRLARERWQEYRQGQGADRGESAQEKPGATRSQDRSHGKDDDQSLRQESLN